MTRHIKWFGFTASHVVRVISHSSDLVRFFNRYKEWESMEAETLQYSLDEDQWEQDWASILSLAGQPGTSLEQTHVFALAHILRRPIIIYGVKYVKSFRGEVLGLARFQGRACVRHVLAVSVILYSKFFFPLFWGMVMHN